MHRSRLRSRLNRRRNEEENEKTTELVDRREEDPSPKVEATTARSESETGRSPGDGDEEKEDLEAAPQEQKSAKPQGNSSTTAALEGLEERNEKPEDINQSVNIVAPLSVLEPHRSDPMLNLRQRHKNLDRVVAAYLPEIHFVGQFVSGQGIIQDSTEGCCCR